METADSEHFNFKPMPYLSLTSFQICWECLTKIGLVKTVDQLPLDENEKTRLFELYKGAHDDGQREEKELTEIAMMTVCNYVERNTQKTA